MPRRIAFVLPSFAGGGAQKVMVMLAGQLDRTRFSPFFVVFQADGPWRTMVSDDVPVISLQCTSLRAALPGLVRTLRREKPDIVVSTLAYVNIGLLLVRWAIGRHVRLIVREANSTKSNGRSLIGRVAYRLAYRTLYRFADSIVCPASYLADELTTAYGLSRSRIAVVLNPVDELEFRAAADPPRRRAGQGRRFVSIGRLNEQKGYDALLDDFAQLPADSYLTIFGEGEQRTALEAQVVRLGLGRRVVLAGFEPNSAPWVAGADALLLPSRWEGMPNVALEALACGTPVIATPTAGGIVEIAANVDNGVVQLARSGSAFVAAMRNVLPRESTDLRSSLLPDCFRLGRAGTRFAAVLDGCLECTGESTP